MANYGQLEKRGRRTACLLWLAVTALCLLTALAVVMTAAYAGWDAGLGSARANATGAAATESQGQCDQLARNLADGNLELARSRMDWLRQRMPVPSCVLTLAPTATAARLQTQPSATIIPPKTAVPTQTQTVPTPALEPLNTAVSGADDWAYDLDALLAEAQAETEARNYGAAIQSLEAIVSIDEDFQRERVRSMLLEALTAQALAHYRSFKLSEAIVLTERAEDYGDIGELNYERYIADTFLIGQRSKSANPAEAVRRFSEIVYQHNPNYMNGLVQGELQDALRYYGDSLLLSGEACQALEQYGAALALQPGASLVSRGLLTAKQQEAAQACGAQNSDAGSQAGSAPAGTPLPIGVRGG